MALPPEFSESEHLQDLVRKYMNREVRDFFQDLGGEDWDPDVSSNRGSLRHGCTHKDDDSLMMTCLRWLLYNHVRTLKFQQPMYGIPVAGFQEARKFKPQISLYFQEDMGDIEQSYAPVTGEVNFRLMGHDASSLNPMVAQTYAHRIRSNFQAGGGYLWRKGKVMCSYTDRENGYKLQILARNEAAARELIERVLDVQNHAPNWSKLNVSENQNAAAAYPTIPPNELIYGKSRRTPRKRPIADVRFQYATLNIHGVPNPISLVDRSGLWPNPLVS